MNYGEFDRLIQFQRFSEYDNGYEVVQEWTAHGLPEPASRTDVSDAERAAAGWIEATVASRFVVRSSDFTRGLTPKDRLICEGLTFDIRGIKQLGRRDYLEITGTARADL
ncbi:head-tail adaptor protein [Pseudogemmobacter sonorensis]|uniref:head-tail adaptor protein n=1 Tax=Pseudogemmobacter sonorensis TaxID=2989681 RepID=UPI0036C29F7A